MVFYFRDLFARSHGKVKSLEAYKFFQDCWVQTVMHTKIEGDVLLMRSDVRPSYRRTSEPHKPWIAVKWKCISRPLELHGRVSKSYINIYYIYICICIYVYIYIYIYIYSLTNSYRKDEILLLKVVCF